MPELLSEHVCFDGVQRFYKYDSAAIGLPMRFSVYLPPGAQGKRLPVLFYLAGLTCTEETFMIKAGAQRAVEHLGVTRHRHLVRFAVEHNGQGDLARHRRALAWLDRTIAHRHAEALRVHARTRHAGFNERPFHGIDHR